MAYIIERNNRFYVVAYDGTDPLTGRERRRWHPAGRCRADAEAIAATLDEQDTVEITEEATPITLGRYLNEQWLPFRKAQLRPTTFRRYSWIVDNYIIPTLGDVPIRRLRAEHLDRLYLDLLTSGNRHGEPLAPKTVYDVHVVLRSCLGDAKRRHYVPANIALEARPPRPQAQARKGPETWTAEQLRAYLDATTHLRLQPAIYLAATTGMRRGELAGLRWGDWQRATHRLSIARSRQAVGGRSMEVPCKTKTSRRCVDLDATTGKGSCTMETSARTRWEPHRAQRSDLHEHRRRRHPSRIRHPTIRPQHRSRRRTEDQISRSSPYAREPARRRWDTDQSRVRTAWSLESRFYDGDLPALDPGHVEPGRD